MARNPVLVSNIPEDLHEWVRNKAKEKSTQNQSRVTMSNLFVEGLILLKQKYDDEEALEAAKNDGEPWLQEAGAHVN